MTWYPQGHDIFFGATVQQSPGAYLYDWGSDVVRWFEHPCEFSGFGAPAGARMQPGVASEAECREYVEEVGYVFYPVYVDYPYLLASDVTPVAPLRPFDPETDEPDFTVEAPSDPGTSTVEEGLTALDADGKELLREELDWSLTPGAQEQEEPASDGSAITDEDRECRDYFDEAPASDPGARSPGAEGEAPDWDYDVDEFEGVYNPLIRATQTVKLRWGTKSWGYRHIVLRHGWDMAADERIRLALQSDRTPELDLAHDLTGSSFIYSLDLSGLPSGMRCRQLVSVSYRTDSIVPVGRHVITSFLEAY